jgi:hypothetical protein
MLGDCVSHRCEQESVEAALFINNWLWIFQAGVPARPRELLSSPNQFAAIPWLSHYPTTVRAQRRLVGASQIEILC